MSQPDSEIRAEIQALEKVLSALAPLDEGTRRLVLGYVQQRFGLAAAETPSPPQVAPLPPAGDAEGAASEASTAAGEIGDIRTLKEKKQPKSAVEMAVLVAFYVSEIAKAPERKTTIGTADITRYFKQADYRLPSQPRVILHQAKNAGYLDSGARGQYSLNPVGYNLVSHGLPRTSAAKRTTLTRRRGQAKSRAKALKKTAARAKPKKRKKTTAQTKPRQTRKKR